VFKLIFANMFDISTVWDSQYKITLIQPN